MNHCQICDCAINHGQAAICAECDKIIELSEEQGLGELSQAEHTWIRAQVEYDWYAVEPQMPYSVAQDCGMAWKELKAQVSEERLRAIQIFYKRNWQPEE